MTKIEVTKNTPVTSGSGDARRLVNMVTTACCCGSKISPSNLPVGCGFPIFANAKYGTARKRLQARQKRRS
jgi:hypothetical protein